jgi:hypothetical protein
VKSKNHAKWCLLGTNRERQADSRPLLTWPPLVMPERIPRKSGGPNASVFTAAPANGIEQCKFNPRNGYFYISIPTTGSSALVSPNIGDGYVLKNLRPVMSTPTHLTTYAAVVAEYHIDPATTGCGAVGGGGGPAGLSIAPNSTTTTPLNGYIVARVGRVRWSSTTTTTPSHR